MFYSIIIGIIILYLFFIMPRIFNRRDFKPFLDSYYAHRGLHDEEVPENSMKAFELAIENNYGIELDVHLTKDEIPVVFHDHDLKRMCNADKNINEFTYEELQVFRLKNSNEKIPKLVDVLNLVDNKVPLIVELKAGAKDNFNLISQRTAEILDEYKGIYCIESFNPLVLLWFKRARPSVIRGQLSTDFAKNKIEGDSLTNLFLTYLCLNFQTKPDFIAYNHKYKNNLSFILCKNLYKTITIAYTIKTENEFLNSKDDFHLFIFENISPEKL